ncbi:hypothetical protein GJ744_006722, partial [Endocarpon pusillum]
MLHSAQAVLIPSIFAREEHLPAVQASSILTLKAIYSRSLKSAKTLVERASDKHLPPPDNVDATLETKNGVTGTIQSPSVISTFKANGYSVTYDKGAVNVFRNTVNFGDETKDMANERTGVPPE